MSLPEVPGLVLSTLTPDILYKSLGERALREDKPFYIVIFASDAEGTTSIPPPYPYGISSWCPSCRIAAPLIESTFKDWPAPVPVIQVGSKLEWRKPSNVWRQQPFNVAFVPTLIRIDPYVDPLDVSKKGYSYQKDVDEIEDATKLRLFVQRSTLEIGADARNSIVVDGEPYTPLSKASTQPRI